MLGSSFASVRESSQLRLLLATLLPKRRGAKQLNNNGIGSRSFSSLRRDFDSSSQRVDGLLGTPRCNADHRNILFARYASSQASSKTTTTVAKMSRSNNNRNNNRNNNSNNSNKRRPRKDPDAEASEITARQTTKRILEMGEEVKSSATSSSGDDGESGGLSTHVFRKLLEERSFWTDADQAIKWWSKRHTSESVAMSFRILDSLADLSSLAQEPQLSAPLLSTKVLNALVQNWLVAWVAKDHKGNDDNVMTPPNMFQRLEDYRINSKTTSRTRRKLRPNLETYQILMEAAAVGSTTVLPPGFNESIARHLMEEGKADPDIDPDVKLVAHVLHGYSARGQIIPMEELTGVLDLLEEIMDSDNDNNTSNNNDNNPENATQSRMVLLFNQALFAIARGNSNMKNARGAEKMLSILHFMEFMASAYPDHAADLHPTVDTYNLVLNGFARAGKGAQAEMVLQNMVKRYAEAFNANINIILNDNGQETADPAKEEEESKGSLMAVAPVPKSFTIAITAFGNSEENYAAEKAQGVLQWQQKLNEDEEGPLYGCIPLETVTYNNVMRAWSWRRSDKAVDRCDSLRKEIYKNKLVPDKQTYGQSLKAIALSNLREKGRLAVQVWREMEFSGVKANDFAQKYFDKCVAVSSKSRWRGRQVDRTSQSPMKSFRR